METRDFKPFALFIALFLAGFAVAGYAPKQAPAPAAPAADPACPGRCRPCPRARPFNIVCPYCRNTVTVLPASAADTGKVAAKAPAAK